MCNFKSQIRKVAELAEYYEVNYDPELEEGYTSRFYENAFDHFETPIVTAGKPNALSLFHWGFIPHWSPNKETALKVRATNVNCRSEEMFEKSSFRDALKNHQRCLIPCTGFYEWKHINNGKEKIPHFIGIKNQTVFSIAGIYSRWKDPDKDGFVYTYTVVTTKANKLMEEIHNSKKRMPVILPRQYEKDWLNTSLTKDDVLALCQPADDAIMNAYTVSKLVSNPKAERNIPEVMKPFEYPQELKLF